jgi:hypothetical protein
LENLITLHRSVIKTLNNNGLNTTTTISNEMKIKLRLEKCAKISLKTTCGKDNGE